MTIVLQDVTTICRFCLSDEEVLSPILDVLSTELTSEDVERCTGVSVFDNFNICYAICSECHNKLQKFSTFRNCCLNNDLRFRLRFPMIFRDLFRDEEEPCDENEWSKELNWNETEATQQLEITDHSYCVETLQQHESAATQPEEVFDTEYEHFVQQIDAGNEYEGYDEIVEEIVEEVVLHSGELMETISQESNVDALIEEIYQETPETQHEAIPFNEEAVNQDLYHQEETQELIVQQTSADESQLDESEESNSMNTTKERKGKKRLCPLCGKLVTSVPDHMLSHTKEQSFACDLCSFVSSRKANLKTHVQTVHQKRVVRRCEKCDRGFSYVDSYNAHMRAKHNVGDYFECKICGMKFRHRGGLNGHLNRKHNEESNCTCPTCGFVCQDKKGLKDHSRVHSNEKPFVCRHCPKGFKSPYARRTHEMIHLGVTFSCAVCEKSYRYKCQLVLHAKKHHAQQVTFGLEENASETSQQE